MPDVLVPLADGVEEMEAVILVDVLRRAECTVITAGLVRRQVTASRGVVLVADVLLSDVLTDSFDAVALPGGAPGTAALRGDGRVIALVNEFASRGKMVAAICAAPLVLEDAGLLDSRRFTSHPGVAAKFSRGTRVNDRVVEDGNIVTSQGPGTSFEFALKLVERLKGAPAATSVAAGMVL